MGVRHLVLLADLLYLFLLYESTVEPDIAAKSTPHGLGGLGGFNHRPYKSDRLNQTNYEGEKGKPTT